MNRYFMNKRLLIGIVGLMVVAMAPAPAPAGTIDLKLKEAMAEVETETAIPVIVRFYDAADNGSSHAGEVAAGKLAELLQDNAAASQGLVKALLRAKGVQGIVSLWIINGMAVSLTVEQIMELAGHPNVDTIVLDQVITAPAVPQPEASADSLLPLAWDNIGSIGAASLWDQGTNGTGVVVATLDTGVDYNHNDLKNRWRGGANSWYDPHGQHAVPHDVSGHGTQVMGLLVGGDSSGTPIGVAPGARWIAAKIFDDQGEASFSDIHLSYQWLLDPDGLADTQDAPHVVNNSWGLSNAIGECQTEFQEDVRVLKSAGMAVVFSAGNKGPAGASNASPANYPESLSVGAVDESLDVALYSSRGASACTGGPFPILSAPGVNILTSDLTFGDAHPDSYVVRSGTSFSAPHVAGAIALLKDAFPGAGASDLEAALADAAADLGATGPDNDFGHGLVNVAVASTLLFNQDGCNDDDNDGYFGTQGCGTPVDCNDEDSAINPAASEIKHDGEDQNCNGYDLTIDIAKAVYLAGDDRLEVQATSDLGSKAALALSGYGSMRWDRKKSIWSISVSRAGGDPARVLVTGVEGIEASPTTLQAADDTVPDNGGPPGKNKK